ncbi:FAD-dependent oxidoreductase [Pseudomonas saxonica]|uniref:FAD-dependent oxidoreductase n=1 Tax=Pseudomonas saxonica TaxID=2600598 RepID=A0ABY3GEY1_9PSED|nr:FAD-dependent oxidoreductase [Pseudomonas saxonica]TWR88095.1 FAD-dependent oxidoreductase [Pseudomonas saxonica]
MTKFPQLLAPGRIGSLQLRNRIIMAPMGSNFAEADGHCGERIQAYYEARARGGAGLLIMGVCSVAFPAGTAEPFQVGVSSDEFLPGLSRLAERVHQHGAKIAMQLQHAGKTSVRDMAEGRQLWVPSVPPVLQSDMMAALTPEELNNFVSSMKRRAEGSPIRVMDDADIAQMIDWFAMAADRAKRAGFDGVEIHAAHGYIIAGFLSSYYNQREDDYGGSLENRARLLLDIIAAVRAKVGDEFAVWLRLDAQELHTPNGISLQDAQAVARMAEAAGVDAVSVSASARIISGVVFTEAPLVQKPDGFLEWTAAIKRSINLPVIAVGRIEPQSGEAALKRGDCDFIAMARKLLADPELPNKLINGQENTIRPCIYCYVCVSQIFINERVKCAVNPMTGHEFEYVISPALTAKHIVIIGAGPAGMEAARVAALRGHRVTLLERSDRLGGTLFFAGLAYAENARLLDNLKVQVQLSSIDVRLNTTASPALLRDLAADQVLVAVGAERSAPAIPGAELDHVWSGDELRRLMTGDRADEIAKRKLSFTQRTLMKAGSLAGVTDSSEALQKLSRMWMPLGKRVTIIGGGLVGLELAEFLLARGRQVTVLESGTHLGRELAIVRRWRVLHEIRVHGGDLKTGASVTAIDGKGVHYQMADGQAAYSEADSVVLAIGAQPNTDLLDELSRAGLPASSIGDCHSIGYIEGAISAGHKAGREA